MNLGEMEQRLALIVRDSSLEPEFARMINDAILELAADFDLPALKLLTPVNLPVTADNWIYPLPENYHKKLFKVMDSDWSPVGIVRSVDDLDKLDPDHDETDTHVTRVAVHDTGVTKSLCVYPKAGDTLRLWYYEKPAVLTDPEDSPDCIPHEFQERVIFPKIIIKNFQLLLDQVENPDFKSLQYWEGKQREGLYGSAAGPIGFINWIFKLQGGPRCRGGRDPIWAGGN
jgi:hypothetical protein